MYTHRRTEELTQIYRIHNSCTEASRDTTENEVVGGVESIVQDRLDFAPFLVVLWLMWRSPPWIEKLCEVQEGKPRVLIAPAREVEDDRGFHGRKE